MFEEINIQILFTQKSIILGSNPDIALPIFILVLSSDLFRYVLLNWFLMLAVTLNFVGLGLRIYQTLIIVRPYAKLSIFSEILSPNSVSAMLPSSISAVSNRKPGFLFPSLTVSWKYEKRADFVCCV